jgi:hypothetical protein
MTWYAQILKDGYAALGYLLYLYGWVLILHRPTWERGPARPARALVWIAAGVFLNWLVRPHLVQLLQVAALGPALIATAAFAGRARRAAWSRRRALAACATAWVAVGLTLPAAPPGLTPAGPAEAGMATGAEIRADIRAQGSRSAVAEAGMATGAEIRSVAPQEARRPGAPSSAPPSHERRGLTPALLVATLVEVLDSRALSLDRVRTGYALTYPEAGSNIDTEFRIRRAADLVDYAPRAMLIAFLAPFPSAWVAKSRLPANTVARRVAAAETLGVYAALACLTFAAWRLRARSEFHALVAACATMMLLLVLLVPNVGAVYRLRYAFLMTLTGLGISVALAEWRHRRVGRSAGCGADSGDRGQGVSAGKPLPRRGLATGLAR